MAPPTETPLEVLIHVGLHKTGTTWLQKRFFSHPSLGFRLPLHRGRHVKAALVKTHALDFDPDEAAARLHPPLREAAGEGAIPVISEERLSGNPHAGAYDVVELADRLGAVFPDGRVLLVIREQRAMIRSTYLQYVRIGGPNDLDEYLHWWRDGQIRYPRFDLAVFRYDRLVELYRSVFGADRVLVLPFERFVESPVDYLAEICAFAGIDPSRETLEALPVDERVHGGIHPALLGLRRRLNPLAVKDTLNPWVLVPHPRARLWYLRAFGRLDRVLPRRLGRRAERRLRERIEDRVGTYYDASNRRTSELIGVDLERYGYRV